jgi:hypothetical protein
MIFELVVSGYRYVILLAFLSCFHAASKLTSQGLFVLQLNRSSQAYFSCNRDVCVLFVRFGFGSLVDFMLASVAPKIAGSIPAEAVGFFGQKDPQHAFLRRGSKAVCPMSQLCGM